MMKQELINLNVKKLKQKFLELLKKLEENKIIVIGQFLEEEVKPYMSIEEFAELIKDDVEGFSVSSLKLYERTYRKLYKDNIQYTDDISLDKADIISRIDDKEAQQEFIERAKDISREQLREEVKEYLEKGEIPKEEVRSIIEINLKYNHEVLKLINSNRTLSSALKQVRQGNLFYSFSKEEKKEFEEKLKTMKEVCIELIDEISENEKYLGGNNE